MTDKEKIHKMLRLLLLLRDVVSDEAIEVWFSKKRDWLDGRTPLEIIEDGDIDILLEAAEQLNSGEPRS